MSSGLPVKTVNWQYNHNNRLFGTTLAADHQNLLLAIKNAMIGFAQSPWTVSKSSNSSTFGNSDLWVAYTDVVWNTAGLAHSWIVLRQTGIGPTFEICIDCNINTAFKQISVYFSYSGFSTGGSTTARPTASDELTIISQTQWGLFEGGSTSRSCVLHVQHSTDGLHTRVFIARNEVVQAVWMFDVPSSAPSGWLYPFVAHIGGSAINVTYSTVALFGVASPFVGRKNDGVAFAANINYPVAAGTETVSGALPNHFDQIFPIWPAEINSSSPSMRGVHGVLPDLYWIRSGPSTVVGAMTGRTAPSDGDKLWTACGQWLIPWDGTSNPVFSL